MVDIQTKPLVPREASSHPFVANAQANLPRISCTRFNSLARGVLVRLRATLTAAVVLSAAGCVLGGGGAYAAEIKEAPRWTKGSDFSSLLNWNLKAEQLVPHGVNPLYYPITPGHKHALERPDHPDGKYRKETVVLNTTEDFDIRGIGKFKTAVVQEEEGILTAS